MRRKSDIPDIPIPFYKYYLLYIYPYRGITLPYRDARKCLNAKRCIRYIKWYNLPYKIRLISK